jgi:hypothetical protein
MWASCCATCSDQLSHRCSRSRPSPPVPGSSRSSPTALGSDASAPTPGSRAGASGSRLAAYFGEGSRCTTSALSRPRRTKTASDLLFKGAVGALSLGVQRAHPRTRKEAPGTTAFPDEPQPKLSERVAGARSRTSRSASGRRALQPCVSGRSRRLRAAYLEERRAPSERRSSSAASAGPQAVASSRPRQSAACPDRPRSSRRDVV